MGSVSLVPIDISEDKFEVDNGAEFDPYKLDYENSGKDAMKDSILKVLKKMVDLSNSNHLKNADGLLAKKPMDQDLQWVGTLENVFQKIDLHCPIKLLLIFVVKKKICMNCIPIEV